MGYAEIAQLVEHNLAKVRVASSSLVFRSKRVSRNADLTFEKESATQLHGASAHEYSPDGVQSYVSRPCAQGRLFYLYAASIRSMVTVILGAQPIRRLQVKRSGRLGARAVLALDCC